MTKSQVFGAEFLRTRPGGLAAVFAVIVTIVALLGAACSAPPASPPDRGSDGSLPIVDRSDGAGARASLNEITGEVLLPMSSYWYSDRENLIVNTAVAFLIYDCVEDAGFGGAPRGGAGKALQDRSYGQWSRALAARNGFSPEIRKIPGVLDAQPERSPVTARQQEAETKCYNSVGRAGFPELLEGLAVDQSVQNRIVQTSLALTDRDPDYLSYRRAWEDCVAAKGLKLAGSDSWSFQGAASKEEEVRMALLDVECKDSSGGAQIPYDILAQYEAAQMKDHQAELNEVASQKAASVERAKQVLRDHGVADAKL